MSVIGMSRSEDARSPTTSFGMSAPRPLPNPLRRATTDLLRQLPIGNGPPGRGIEHDDGLPERWGFGQADRPRHDAATDPVAEMRSDLGDDLLRESGPGVVHRQDDGSDFE